MENNAHTIRSAEVKTLESEDINHMKWPEYSIDLILNEHARNALDRHASGGFCPPQTVQNLKVAMTVYYRIYSHYMYNLIKYITVRI